MKRPLLLPLAIALALSGTDALALGLGTIHVNSKLNQPLDAEIPILQGTAGEAEGLVVQLAAAEDFDRVGLNRARLTIPLEFSLIKGNRGDLAIKVTSKEAVREPFLDFLVEANWPKGRLLREYTVLLDPPVMAPSTGAAVTAAAKPQERAPTQAIPESRPKTAPAKPPRSAPVAVAPSAPAPEKPAPATPAPKRTAGSGEYTVEAGDTLSGIARDMRPDESTNVNQMMLALLKQNPNAFYKDNINALKRGSILRIPSADQIKSVGSASEAAAQVHSQIEDWRGGAAAKPMLVADTGSAPSPKTPAAKTPTGTSTSASTTKSGSERLELVPPKAGKDSIAMADRPGSGAGSAGGSSELKSELARTKEALTSRDQEAGELKSRVKELEDTKGKTDRLLTLKDSEIADLQRKLKELQSPGAAGSKSATTTATTPSVTTTTPPAATTSPSSTTPPSTTTPATGTKSDKVSKEDIWGATPDSKTAAATPPPASTGSTPTASTTPPASSTTPPSSTTTPPTTTPSSSMPIETGSPVSATPATTATTPSSTTMPSSTSPSSTPTAADTSSAGTTTPSPSTSTASSTPPSASATPSVKPVTTPVKTDTKVTMQPHATTPAWYEQSWVKPAAIGAAALLLLAGLLGMRKRKVVPAAGRGSIAGAFGDTPLADGDAAAMMPETEEQVLRDQLMLDPRNLGLHLELLSLLYSERNVDAFEQAAESMHMHVVDTTQAEWLEARAMGQELAPHNPLFSDAPVYAFDDEAVTAPHATPMFDHDEVFNRREPIAEVATRADNVFDFDLDHDVPATQTPVPAASEGTFAFDNIAPIDFGREAQHEISSVVAPEPLPVDDDEFPGEDGVGTKLDLAKAYLDMGDPEGARSMLEEVLAEGNDTQKGEAQRLMAEIK